MRARRKTAEYHSGVDLRSHGYSSERKGDARVNRFLRDFGEDRVEAAVGVVGPTFYTNPGEARHPLYFGNGVYKDGQEREGQLVHKGVEFSAQGPLPILFRGKEFISQIVTFSAPELPSRHEALCLVSGEVRVDRPQKLYVAVEDHVHMVVQHEGGGAIWENFDAALENVHTHGGAVMLFPEVAQHLPKQKIMEIAQQSAEMLGLREIELLPREKRRSIPNKDIIGDAEKYGKKDALQRTNIIKSEYVVLPWSEQPFTHLEVVDFERPGDIHHVWIFGPVVGMDNVPFRPHSACSSSEVLGAHNCDCPDQLDATFRRIVDHGYGMVMYLDQEARGHGPKTKVQTWGFNITHNIDLIAAFQAAAWKEDLREFGMVKEVLDYLGVRSVVLMSNNVAVKENGLGAAGVDIVGRMPVSVEARSQWCETDHLAKKNTRGDEFGSEKEIEDNRKNRLRRH